MLFCPDDIEKVIYTFVAESLANITIRRKNIRTGFSFMVRCKTRPSHRLFPACEKSDIARKQFSRFLTNRSPSIKDYHVLPFQDSFPSQRVKSINSYLAYVFFPPFNFVDWLNLSVRRLGLIVSLFASPDYRTIRVCQVIAVHQLTQTGSALGATRCGVSRPSGPSLPLPMITFHISRQPMQHVFSQFYKRLKNQTNPACRACGMASR